MAVEIQVRRGAASVWTSVNPTLAQGEWGLETDTDNLKIGNGTSAWTSLPYQVYPYASVVNLISAASVATEAYAFSITNAASVSLAASIAAGGGGSGSVSSVFGRTGAVTAQVGDYSAYYDLNGKASAASTAAIAASDPAGLAASVKALSLLSANNLADVADAGTSRQDIHIPALTSVAAVQTASVATFTGLPVVDGYQTANGDAILVTSAGVNNGPWLMPASGSVGSWTRPTEFATGASVHGRTIAVMNGTVGANQVWQLNTPTAGILVGTTTQSWAQSVGASTGGTSGNTLPVFNVKNYGATGNGSTDDTADIKSTIAAASVGGGIVYFPPGTYKITSGLTCSTSPPPYSPVYFEGAGKWASTLACAWSTASVDAVRMYNSNLGSASVYGGGISGLTIDGTSVSGAHCSGLHLGDLFNAQVDVAIQNFATANSVGAWFDNYYLYTEQTNARLYVSNNTTNVAFDNSSPNTSTYVDSGGSFDRGVFDIYINQGTSTFDGVVFRNGAYLADGQINIRGNFGVGSSLSSAVLRLTGSTPSAHSAGGITDSAIATSVINIGVEVDGEGTGPHTLVCDADSGTAILNCTGILNFATAGPFEAASNPNISFWGPIYGDATLSELWTGTVGNGLASSFTANGTTSVVVTNYWVQSASQIVIQLTTPGGTPGQPYVYSISAGTSITFRSQVGDTSTYSFRLLS